MKYVKRWATLSILALFTIGLLGLLLRSKIVFSIPFINYNHLVEAHFRFTFSGWVTLALLSLMRTEMLPASAKDNKYNILLAGITIGSWAMLVAFLWKGYNTLSITVSLLFIGLTYIFSFVFVKDILKAGLLPSVRWLVVSSMICLVISSFGAFVIDYIYFSNNFQALLYRDSLFSYLHFQYNGFFSLSIMALFFNDLGRNLPDAVKRSRNGFIVLQIISLVPALFLSYLWRDPNTLFRTIAVVGSILTLASCLLFVRTCLLLRPYFHAEEPKARSLLLISLASFALKLFLQCLTIFPVIGNAIFGNRPVIMGFLHLVFLGFVSLYILALFTKRRILDPGNSVTKAGLAVFATGVILNEILLISQGLITMFGPASTLFPWMLWGVAIWLFAGTALITISIFPRHFFS